MIYPFYIALWRRKSLTKSSMKIGFLQFKAWQTYWMMCVLKLWVTLWKERNPTKNIVINQAKMMPSLKNHIYYGWIVDYSYDRVTSSSHDFCLLWTWVKRVGGLAVRPSTKPPYRPTVLPDVFPGPTTGMPFLGHQDALLWLRGLRALFPLDTCPTINAVAPYHGNIPPLIMAYIPFNHPI